MTQQHPLTLTDRVRGFTGRLTTRAGETLHRAGVHPDAITLFGLVLVAVCAVLIAMGRFFPAFVVFAIAMPLDALDGATARAMGRADQFGGVFDSSLDRYADGLLFAGLSYYFAAQGQLSLMLLALVALVGAYATSYIRARAGEADLSVKVGWFTRMERVITLAVGLLIPALLVPALVVLAVGTNVTAFQRLWFVYRAINHEN